MQKSRVSGGGDGECRPGTIVHVLFTCIFNGLIGSCRFLTCVLHGDWFFRVSHWSQGYCYVNILFIACKFICLVVPFHIEVVSQVSNFLPSAPTISRNIELPMCGLRW